MDSLDLLELADKLRLFFKKENAITNEQTSYVMRSFPLKTAGNEKMAAAPIRLSIELNMTNLLKHDLKLFKLLTQNDWDADLVVRAAVCSILEQKIGLNGGDGDNTLLPKIIRVSRHLIFSSTSSLATKTISSLSVQAHVGPLKSLPCKFVGLVLESVLVPDLLLNARIHCLACSTETVAGVSRSQSFLCSRCQSKNVRLHDVEREMGLKMLVLEPSSSSSNNNSRSSNRRLQRACVVRVTDSCFNEGTITSVSTFLGHVCEFVGVPLYLANGQLELECRSVRPLTVTAAALPAVTLPPLLAADPMPVELCLTAFCSSVFGVRASHQQQQHQGTIIELCALACLLSVATATSDQHLQVHLLLLSPLRECRAIAEQAVRMSRNYVIHSHSDQLLLVKTKTAQLNTAAAAAAAASTSAASAGTAAGAVGSSTAGAAASTSAPVAVAATAGSLARARHAVLLPNVDLLSRSDLTSLGLALSTGGADIRLDPAGSSFLTRSSVVVAVSEIRGRTCTGFAASAAALGDDGDSVGGGGGGQRARKRARHQASATGSACNSIASLPGVSSALAAVPFSMCLSANAVDVHSLDRCRDRVEYQCDTLLDQASEDYSPELDDDEYVGASIVGSLVNQAQQMGQGSFSGATMAPASKRLLSAYFQSVRTFVQAGSGGGGSSGTASVSVLDFECLLNLARAASLLNGRQCVEPVDAALGIAVLDCALRETGYGQGRMCTSPIGVVMDPVSTHAYSSAWASTNDHSLERRLQNVIRMINRFVDNE